MNHSWNYMNFEKRVVRTKLEIYVFIAIIVWISLLVDY